MSNEKETSADRLANGFRRAMDVMMAVSARGGEGCSFSDLKEATGDLPAPTLSRLLKSLQAAEWLEHAGRGGNYRMAAFYERAARSVLGGQRRQDQVLPVLQSLAEGLGESAAYYEPIDGVLMLLAKHEMPDGTHYTKIFGAVPEYCWHGFGQVWLASVDAAERERMIDLTPHRPHGGKRAMLALCQEIQKSHVRIERGEHRSGCWRVVAPVCAGINGRYLGSIGVSANSQVIEGDEHRFCHQVQAAARQSSDLFHFVD